MTSELIYNFLLVTVLRWLFQTVMLKFDRIVIVTNTVRHQHNVSEALYKSISWVKSIIIFGYYNIESNIDKNSYSHGTSKSSHQCSKNLHRIPTSNVNSSHRKMICTMKIVQNNCCETTWWRSQCLNAILNWKYAMT